MNGSASIPAHRLFGAAEVLLGMPSGMRRYYLDGEHGYRVGDSGNVWTVAELMEAAAMLIRAGYLDKHMEDCR